MAERSGQVKRLQQPAHTAVIRVAGLVKRLVFHVRRLQGWGVSVKCAGDYADADRQQQAQEEAEHTIPALLPGTDPGLRQPLSETYPRRKPRDSWLPEHADTNAEEPYAEPTGHP